MNRQTKQNITTQKNRKRTDKKKKEIKIDKEIKYSKELKEKGIGEGKDNRLKMLVATRGQLGKDFTKDGK